MGVSAPSLHRESTDSLIHPAILHFIGPHHAIQLQCMASENLQPRAVYSLHVVSLYSVQMLQSTSPFIISSPEYSLLETPHALDVCTIVI